MRKLGRFEPMLGRAEIGGIQIDVKSRDDIPAILLGLQGLYLNEAVREAVFELLLDRFGEDRDLKVGRPGMELWTVLVLAVLKQGLGCDFDRLREHANTHVVLRQLLGHSELEPVTYSYDQVIRNVSLLDEDTLRDINELVVRHGHSLCDHDVGERLAGRCDSFAVETDVHYPTDRNLLWDAARVMVRIAAALADEWNLTGWRQAKHLTVTLRRLYQRVASTRRSEAWREDVDAFLIKCEELLAKTEATRASLLERGALPEELKELDRYIAHTKRQIDQTDRRILQEEEIPQKEKVFSVFEEHTRWNSKGKAGVPVELGVPVAIVEDQYQFILEHQILWQGGDTDAAVPVIVATRLALPGTRRLQFRPRLSQSAKPGRPRRHAGTQRHARQGPPVRQPQRTRGAAGLRTGAPAASRRRVGDQQSRAARPGPGAHPWQGGLRPHGRLVHPRCKCAPCRFLDPRTGTRTTQAPATKSCLTSPGNRASAARTGLPAALHGRYFQKSPIWAPKSPPARRLPPNVADQVHLTLNPPVRSGSNLTAEAGSNSKKGVFLQTLTTRPN